MLFLARVLGILYVKNNVSDEGIQLRCDNQLFANAGIFLVFFLAFVIRTLLKDGYAVNPDTGIIYMAPYKYLNNLLDMWPLLLVFVVGVAGVLYGIIRTILDKIYIRGIWFAGIGTVLTVLVLLLIAGWNDTAYYPSNADLQSSLTIRNSSSSEFTLRTMAYVSLLIPFVLVYIAYCWYSLDREKMTKDDILDGHAY